MQKGVDPCGPCMCLRAGQASGQALLSAGPALEHRECDVKSTSNIGGVRAAFLSPFAYFISSRSSLPIRAVKQIGYYSGFIDEQIEMKHVKYVPHTDTVIEWPRWDLNPCIF